MKQKNIWSKVYNWKANIWLTIGAMMVLLFVAWAVHNIDGLSADAARPAPYDLLGDSGERPVRPPFLSRNFVSSPTQKDVWVPGKTYTIRWKLSQSWFSNNSRDSVTITMSAPQPQCLWENPQCDIMQTQPYTIISAAKNNGSYTWTVPENLDLIYTGKQQITVSLDKNPSVTATSEVFEVAESSVVQNKFNITSPSAGEVWQMGNKQKIVWTPASKCTRFRTCPPLSEEAKVPQTVTIYLVEPGNEFSKPIVTTIAKDVANTGSYIWPVPKNLAQRTKSKTIQIVGGTLGAEAWTGESAEFAIVASSPIRICPDEWYSNQMPGSGGGEYLIVNGERAEIADYDIPWIKGNCKVRQPSPVY